MADLFTLSSSFYLFYSTSMISKSENWTKNVDNHFPGFIFDIIGFYTFSYWFVSSPLNKNKLQSYFFAFFLNII